MIFTWASAEDQKGRFLLDTGAPKLVINRAAGAGKAIEAAGITDSFYASELKVRNFRWANVERKSIQALALDISHMESTARHSISGIIGYEILKNFELYLNIENNQIALLNPDKSEVLRVASPLLVLPFTMLDHLPLVEVQIGDQTLRFALDTGAGANLIDLPYKDLLPPELLQTATSEIVRGLDQQLETAYGITLEDTQIASLNLPDLKYLFIDLSHLHAITGVKIDGILGFPFFSRIKCSINYPQEKLYIWELTRIEGLKD